MCIRLNSQLIRSSSCAGSAAYKNYVKAYINDSSGNAATIDEARQEAAVLVELQKCVPDESMDDARQLTLAFESMDELASLLIKFKIVEDVTADKIRAADPNKCGFRSMHSVSKRLRTSSTTLSSHFKFNTKMLEDWLNDAISYLHSSMQCLWDDSVLCSETIAKKTVLVNEKAVTLQAFRRGGMEETGTWWGNTTTKANFKTVKTKAENSCLQVQPKDLAGYIDDMKKVHTELIELADIFNDGFSLACNRYTVDARLIWSQRGPHASMCSALHSHALPQLM